MERLNYTLVVISTKEVKSVCAGLWFDDKEAAERYAEGVTAGLALAGKKNHAVIMHLTDAPENQKALISKNLTFRHTVYISDNTEISPWQFQATILAQKPNKAPKFTPLTAGW